MIFNLPIPRFDPNMKLHRDLAAAAERAEKVAAIVPLEEGEHFTRARKRIRDALRADDVADEIDKLVESLLETRPQQIATQLSLADAWAAVTEQGSGGRGPVNKTSLLQNQWLTTTQISVDVLENRGLRSGA